MKFRPVPALLLIALAGSLNAQDTAPKTTRKTLVFPAKGRTPEEPKPVAKAAAQPPPPAATPTAKATPKPADTAPADKDASASPAIVTSTVPPEPSQIVRAFFGLLEKGNVDAAYDGLMKGSNIAERPEEVRSLKTKTRQALEIFGKVHGYDLVEMKPVGERLMRTTYLSLGHDLPLRWRFYFYKPEADWRLIDIRVDDKLTGIFEEAIEDPPKPEESRP